MKERGDMILTIGTTPSGDWVGLYKDGILIDEGHDIDWPRVLPRIFRDLQIYQRQVQPLRTGYMPAKITLGEGKTRPGGE